MTPEPPGGARCFLDANIFVYHFTQDPHFSTACSDFMARVEAGEVIAHTSNLMLGEALHRIMLNEVQSRFGTAKPLSFVQKRPDIIPQLIGYHSAGIGISRLKLHILQLDLLSYAAISAVASKYSLLTGDASTVTLMQRDGISYLMSNDNDFDGIAGIQVCKPR